MTMHMKVTCGCGFHREVNREDDGYNQPLVRALVEASEHAAVKQHTVTYHGEFRPLKRTVPAPQRRPAPKDSVPA
jgi:hypothetical protein